MKANSINDECIDKQFVGFSHILRSVIVIINTVPCSSGKLNDITMIHQTQLNRP